MECHYKKKAMQFIRKKLLTIGENDIGAPMQKAKYNIRAL